MKERERALLERQSVLLQRSALLRDRWGRDAAGFLPAFGAVDLAADGWRWLRAHPEWPAGVLLLAVALRPRRLWRWGWRAAWAWRMWRRARPWAAPWLRAARRVWDG